MTDEEDIPKFSSKWDQVVVKPHEIVGKIEELAKKRCSVLHIVPYGPDDYILLYIQYKDRPPYIVLEPTGQFTEYPSFDGVLVEDQKLPTCFYCGAEVMSLKRENLCFPTIVNMYGTLETYPVCTGCFASFVSDYTGRIFNPIKLSLFPACAACKEPIYYAEKDSFFYFFLKNGQAQLKHRDCCGSNK